MTAPASRLFPTHDIISKKILPPKTPPCWKDVRVTDVDKMHIDGTGLYCSFDQATKWTNREVFVEKVCGEIDAHCPKDAPLTVIFFCKGGELLVEYIILKFLIQNNFKEVSLIFVDPFFGFCESKELENAINQVQINFCDQIDLIYRSVGEKLSKDKVLFLSEGKTIPAMLNKTFTNNVMVIESCSFNSIVNSKISLEPRPFEQLSRQRHVVPIASPNEANTVVVLSKKYLELLKKTSNNTFKCWFPLLTFKNSNYSCYAPGELVYKVIIRDNLLEKGEDSTILHPPQEWSVNQIEKFQEEMKEKLFKMQKKKEKAEYNLQRGSVIDKQLPLLDKHLAFLIDPIMENSSELIKNHNSKIHFISALKEENRQIKDTINKLIEQSKKLEKEKEVFLKEVLGNNALLKLNSKLGQVSEILENDVLELNKNLKNINKEIEKIKIEEETEIEEIVEMREIEVKNLEALNDVLQKITPPNIFDMELFSKKLNIKHILNEIDQKLEKNLLKGVLKETNKILESKLDQKLENNFFNAVKEIGKVIEKIDQTLVEMIEVLEEISCQILDVADMNMKNNLNIFINKIISKNREVVPIVKLRLIEKLGRVVNEEDVIKNQPQQIRTTLLKKAADCFSTYCLENYKNKMTRIFLRDPEIERVQIKQKIAVEGYRRTYCKEFTFSPVYDKKFPPYGIFIKDMK